MTYSELSQRYGEEVAARMLTVLSLESRPVLIQTLLDFMGTKTLDEWAVAIERGAHEPTAG